MKPLAAAPLDLTDPESHADEAPVLFEAASCEEGAHVACCLTPPVASWQKWDQPPTCCIPPWQQPGHILLTSSSNDSVSPAGLEISGFLFNSQLRPQARLRAPSFKESAPPVSAAVSAGKVSCAASPVAATLGAAMFVAATYGPGPSAPPSQPFQRLSSS